MDNINLKRTDSSDPVFRSLITHLDADLRERNGDMMNIYDSHNIIEYIETVVIAYLNESPVACGCFKKYDRESAEIKRMYVTREARGRGISALVLNELEAWAKSLGFTRMILETGSKQQEALGLYKRAGYLNIPAYHPYINLPDSVCFEKNLNA